MPHAPEMRGSLRCVSVTVTPIGAPVRRAPYPALRQRGRRPVGSVGSDDAELVAGWILEYAGRPLPGLGARDRRCSGRHHVLDIGPGAVDEEVEVKANLGLLGFGHGL